MPYFEELGDLTQLLRRARQHRELVRTRPETQQLNTADDLISHHLKQVAYHTIRAESDYIVNNFRIAAFNLAFKFRGQASSTGRLPNVPDRRAQYEGSLYGSLSGEDRSRVDAFLKKTKPSQLKLVLDLLDAISPLVLLLQHPLNGHHVISRENLLKVKSTTPENTATNFHTAV